MNMDMDDDGSGDMTFTSWSTYKVKIIFDSWNVQTEWEFALSWIAVFFLPVIYHGIRYMIILIEDTPDIQSDLKQTTSSNRRGYQSVHSQDVEHGHCDTQLDNDGVEASDEKSHIHSQHNSSQIDNENATNTALKLIAMRLLHSLLSGLNYGMSLFMMFVAMTFNPSLFLALIFGYTLGDFMFFNRSNKVSNECH